jgi:hypothetical protein
MTGLTATAVIHYARQHLSVSVLPQLGAARHCGSASLGSSHRFISRSNSCS